jgi:hypothetical protein
MTTPATLALQRRARAARAAATIRAWEYRQRRHAKGAWFRLRRLLASVESAWAITAEDSDRLEREGFTPDPIGGELEPSKRIFVVPERRLLEIANRQPVALGLGSELLVARCLALHAGSVRRHDE